MALITLNSAQLAFGDVPLLDRTALSIETFERIGLIGRNGTGKSSLLKILAGLEHLDDGMLQYQQGLNLAYVAQEPQLRAELSVFDAVSEGLAPLKQVLEQYYAGDGDLNALQNTIELQDGWNWEQRVTETLQRLHLDGDALVSSLSGGTRKRVALGQALVTLPDILLLDEPTNHLDVETIQWLESYLLEQTVPLVVISHDRTFLDRVCNQIVATERGISRTYLGNYSQHLEQKELEREATQAAYERQQKELGTQQAFIDRFRASATRSTQAKSREKLLDKVERIEAPLEGTEGPRFQFPPAPRSGRLVASLKDLSHSYDDRLLFLGANLEVERGDRIALVGPNGAGKSTLLRFVLGLEQPEEGEGGIGEHNVIPAYFEQNQAEALDLNRTVIDTLFSAVPDWTQTQVRSLLGRFGLSNDSVFKNVGQLSGGEKARLALALMLVTPCNLLVLDEPTNHLDIPAKEMLEDAVRAYEGAALVVSHDRYFISRVANRIVELRDGELVVYRGDYAYYLQKKEEERQEAEQAREQEARSQKREANRLKQKSKTAGRKS